MVMANMRKFIVIVILFLSGITSLYATHYRAGEITYKQISGYTYEVTVFTYTDPGNIAADRQEIEVFFGDGKSEIVPRANGNGQIVNPDINNTIKMNIYRTTHTYPGPYSYLINIVDQNRVDNIKNINNGNSVSIPIYIECLLIVKPAIGNNQSPVLLMPPIDVGCVNKTFTHNPSAYDPDGDSLVFSIIAPKMSMGIEVPSFTIPAHSNSFSIELNTGQLTWDKPTQAGHYNWAILIQEFRGGKMIGFVVRDMQVYIYNNCDNSPPLLTSHNDTCVEANKLLQGTIFATDPNPGQTIKLQYFGGPFVQMNSPAKMTPANPEGPYTGVTGIFRWSPSCNAIRYTPHMAVFKAMDNHNTNPLFDINYWNIKVVGPAPQNLSIVKDSNGFKINWDRDTCRIALGYKIYRRIDSSYWQHGACETGVPAYTGYVLFDTTKGVNNAKYFDNNNGRGISPLTRYCYMITSWYYPRNEDGTVILIGEKTESYASKEVCAIILRTQPIITKVSVEKTAGADGKIQVEWIKPNILDSNQFKPPYKFQLQRSNQANGIFSNAGAPYVFSSFAQLLDAAYLDSSLNTLDQSYYYKVLFYCTNNGNDELIEESNVAGSVRLALGSTDNSLLLSWKADVPWINKESVIYKKNTSNTFDSIGISSNMQFIDTGLVNGQRYCYFVETKGNYNQQYYPLLLRNKSQEICGIPKDTIRPCAPTFTIDTPCNSFNILEVKLNWTYPTSCNQDVVKYRIYWRKNSSEIWKIVDSVVFGSNQYIDKREQLKFSIAGCYAVAAVDSFNNQSYLTNAKCIDNCPFYSIPTVFTPNADGKNDLLNPFPYRFIDKVDISIFNRWGQEVFHTNDLDINWNGTDQKSAAELSEGVYFYIAEVSESYLDGTKKRVLRGTINIIR